MRLIVVRMHLIRITIFAMVLPLFAGSLQADGKKPLTEEFPDLLGKGVMTYDKKTSSSTCIGQITTPRCAVETQMACLMWGDKNLCRETEHYYSDYLTPGGYSALGYAPYELTSVYRLTAEDIYNWGAVARNKYWRAGDLVIQVADDFCRPLDDCYKASRDDPKRKPGEGCPATNCSLPSPDDPKFYILRHHQGLGWLVVDEWYPVPPLLQKLFGSRK